MAIPVAARSKAWVCCLSLAGIGGFESCWRHGCLSLASGVFCQVEVSAYDYELLAQGSPTDCGVAECDRESLIIRRA